MTQLSSHSSRVCSRDGDTRTSSTREVAQRSASRSARATPNHSRGAAPGHAGVGEDRELLRRPLGAAARAVGSVSARRCCATRPRSDSG